MAILQDSKHPLTGKRRSARISKRDSNPRHALLDCMSMTAEEYNLNIHFEEIQKRSAARPSAPRKRKQKRRCAKRGKRNAKRIATKDELACLHRSAMKLEKTGTMKNLNLSSFSTPTPRFPQKKQHNTGRVSSHNSQDTASLDEMVHIIISDDDIADAVVRKLEVRANKQRSNGNQPSMLQVLAVTAAEVDDKLALSLLHNI